MTRRGSPGRGTGDSAAHGTCWCAWPGLPFFFACGSDYGARSARLARAGSGYKKASLPADDTRYQPSGSPSHIPLLPDPFTLLSGGPARRARDPFTRGRGARPPPNLSRRDSLGARPAAVLHHHFARVARGNPLLLLAIRPDPRRRRIPPSRVLAATRTPDEGPSLPRPSPSRDREPSVEPAERQEDGHPQLLPPLLQPPEVRVDAHPVALLHVPLGPALVHLRVQVLQAEDLPAVYEQGLKGGMCAAPMGSRAEDLEGPGHRQASVATDLSLPRLPLPRLPLPRLPPPRTFPSAVAAATAGRHEESTRPGGVGVGAELDLRLHTSGIANPGTPRGGEEWRNGGGAAARRTATVSPRVPQSPLVPTSTAIPNDVRGPASSPTTEPRKLNSPCEPPRVPDSRARILRIGIGIGICICTCVRVCICTSPDATRMVSTEARGAAPCTCPTLLPSPPAGRVVAEDPSPSPSPPPPPPRPPSRWGSTYLTWILLLVLPFTAFDPRHHPLLSRALPSSPKPAIMQRGGHERDMSRARCSGRGGAHVARESPASPFMAGWRSRDARVQRGGECSGSLGTMESFRESTFPGPWW
ncbi:hypothetical protein B2J93_2723 [Marssonina coronariae]|uniref:Uncharacterized protein n=1 Tax=Diplocarpon coronariae TaxID=2795749 RepID=A0A218Z5J2_9HELO|nr:hypothetical protein B2J93_2723 [Marssonina coronariae]